jgi:DNA primase
MLIGIENIRKLLSSLKINLEKRGKKYFFSCPFHKDNHPSSTIDIEKELFYCFSGFCNFKGKNIFNF